MALAGLTAGEIKPTALILNILVALIGSIQFWKAGHFSWKLFWPFALLSAPAAWLGGYIHLSQGIFRPLVGAVLWISAIRFLIRPEDPPAAAPPGKIVALGSGAGIGFLAGLTGTGGGIFLTPLLLLFRWAHTKNAAAVSAVFILVNSTSGLLGYLHSGRTIPAFAWPLAVAAVLGGFAGSYFGSRKFPVRIIRILLAVVLAIAGTKLIFTLS